MIELFYIISAIILIPGIIFGSIASAKVNSTFAKYSKVFAEKNISANEMARKVLDASGLENVKIKQVQGKLTDHYNPKTKELALSSEVYESSSIASLGVAAHEIGHAIQDAKGYKPLKIRNFFSKISGFGSFLLLPIIILTVITLFVPISGNPVFIILMSFGCGFYGFSIIFNLATLPVELDASKRTYEILVTSGLLTEEEFEGVKKVLKAAALTYVAALAISILQLLRFVFWILLVFKKD